MRSWLIRYGVAAGGALLALPLAYLGFQLGARYVRWSMPTAGWERLLPPLLGWSAGLWIGAVLGCWGALRSIGVSHARGTAKLLAVLLLLAIILWLGLSPELTRTTVIVGCGGLLLGLAVLSRWLVEHGETS
jgi:hypothetical protein